MDSNNYAKMDRNKHEGTKKPAQWRVGCGVGNKKPTVGGLDNRLLCLNKI